MESLQPPFAPSPIVSLGEAGFLSSDGARPDEFVDVTSSMLCLHSPVPPQPARALGEYLSRIIPGSSGNVH